MAYTGYKIIQYIDENPNSSTYGQTWEERVVDTTNCPEGEDEWTLISSNCELTTSGYTGRRINVFYNSTTGEYSSTTTSDVTCSASTLEEIWVDFGEVYCEEREDGTYTGWGIQEQKQTNSNLLNYGEIRKIRVQDAQCIDETAPEWQEITRQCHMMPDMMSCMVYFDGTVDITQIDINPSSPSFNQIRTISDFSEDCVCEPCDSVEEYWSYVADYCGNQMPSEYQLSGLTDDTVYHVYRMYETCIIDGQSGRTRPTNVYSAETYQTGVSGCTYRWVDTGERECVELHTRWVIVPGEYECSGTTKMTKEKQQVSYDSGTTWTDTGNYRTGSTVIEYNSTDCGYTPAGSGDYLTFVAQENGSFSFSGSSTSNTVQYSLDSGSTWTTLASGASTPTILNGERIMWKGTMRPPQGFPTDGIGTFSSTNMFKAEGNIMSLLFDDNFVGQTSINAFEFWRLFFECSGLTSAENLILPATTLADDCYYFMFYGCTSLATAPQLPATTLAPYCYGRMFEGCTSLTTAPSILPATTLAEYCYDSMFEGCTSLTTSPQLPATTLAYGCYSSMFYGCTYLSAITCLATDISATNCTSNWLSYVSSSGTFTKNASMTSWTSGSDGIPSGWTVQNYVS